MSGGFDGCNSDNELLSYKKMKLESGLTILFYQESSLPRNSGDLFLVVKVGHLNEQRDECGFSHFLEHLLLHAIVEDDANLLTNLSNFEELHETFQDNTTFGFHVYNEKQMSIAMNILAKIATKTNLEDKHLAHERDVITVENTEHIEDEDNHIRDSIFENLVSTKLNITELSPTEIFQSNISSITSDDVTKFYKKWYKLSNMALICVGNFQFQEFLNMAQVHFPRQVEQEQETLARQINMRDNPILLQIQNDKLDPCAFMTFKRPRPTTKELNDFKLYWDAATAMNAFNQITDSNLSVDVEDKDRVMGEIQNVGPHILYIFQTEFDETPEPTTYILEFLFMWMRGAREFDLPQRHIQRAREQIVSELESNMEVFRSDVHFRCSTLYSKLKDNFLYDDAVFDPIGVLRIAHEWRDSDLCSSSLSFLESCTRSIIIANLFIDEKIVKKLWTMSQKAVLKQPVPFEENESVEFSALIGDSSFDDKDFAERHEYNDVLEWRLCNGMKVAYHHSPIGNMCSLFGFGYGGLSQSKKENFSRHYASAVVEVLRTSGLDIVFKNSCNVEASVNINQYSRSFQMVFRRHELEVALQRAYLLFVTNEKPSEIENLENVLEEIQMAINDDKTLGFDEVLEIARGSSDLIHKVPGEEVNKINLDKACKYYNKCFKDPTQFTIIMVGNLEVDVVESLIKKYLGSIPKKKCSRSFPTNLRSLKKVSLAFPNKQHRLCLQPLTDTKLADCYISVPLSLDTRHMDWDKILIESLLLMMTHRLEFQIRFLMGKVYTVDSDIEYDGGLDCNSESAIMTFSFKALANQSVSKLVDESVKALESFRRDGPNQQELTLVKVKFDPFKIQGPDEIMKKLVQAYKSISSDEDIASILKVQAEQESKILAMEIESWRKEVKRILRYEFTNRHVSVIVIPQESESQESPSPSKSN